MTELHLDLSTLLAVENFFGSGMSQFQMKYFVIDDHITPYRKFKQAVVEAKARLESLTTYGFDLEELQLKLDNAAINISDFDILKRGLAAVEVRRMQFEINRKKALVKQVEQEAQFFLDQMDCIVKENFDSVEDFIEKLKDPNYIFESEKDFWVKKLSRGVLSDMINFGTISKGLYEAILSLPTDVGQMIIKTGIQEHQGHLQVALEHRDTILSKQD